MKPLTLLFISVDSMEELGENVRGGERKQRSAVGRLFRRLAWERERGEVALAGIGEEGPDGALRMLDRLHVQIADMEEVREQLPVTGPLVVVCNHPFGVLDGLLALAWLGQVRGDVRVLSAMAPYRWMGWEHWILEMPRGRIGEEGNWSKVLGHLAAGGVLVVFPSMRISRFSKTPRTVTDGRWSDVAAWLQERSGASVVPMYIHARDTGLAKLLELVHPKLRVGPWTGKVRREETWTVSLRCGTPIRLDEVSGLKERAQRTRFFRARTFALAARLEPWGWQRWVQVSRRMFQEVQEYRQQPAPVVAPVPQEVLHEHVRTLEEFQLFAQGGFACYFVPYARMGPWMHEIGRLRELTFRAVAEGTHEEIDLDEFDLTYHHLVLWDEREGQIAGAYRVGMGGPIFERFGHRGFYTATLFRMRKAFRDILPESMELGRSFVPMAYQKHRLPLFLLWRGLLTVSQRFPQYRYLIGPVSISGAYNPLSKWLMMSFASGYSLDSPLRGSVQARNPVRFPSPVGSKQDLEALLAGVGNDARKLDRIIGDIDPDQHAMPVLLKRYLAQNAKVLAFNRDPQFNDAIDGLIVLDLHDLPHDTRTGLEQALR